MTGKDHWQQSALPVATRRPPWCPTAEDGDILLRATLPALTASTEPSLIVMGVTPETIQLNWPANVHLLAVDSSPTMIDRVWQPNPRLRSEVICAQWQEMPFPDASIDAAVGDGSLNALASFSDVPDVLCEATRVLRPGGVLALRCFVKPDLAMTPADVADAALRQEYPHIAAFRLPFACAVAGPDNVVRLGDMLDRFNAFFPDREKLSQATGWPPAEIARADIDSGSEIRLNFPTEEQLLAAIVPHFEVRDISRGSYTMSDNCPTLHLVRRDY